MKTGCNIRNPSRSFRPVCMCTDLTLQKIKVLYSDTSLSHSPLRWADSQGFPDGDHGVWGQVWPWGRRPGSSWFCTADVGRLSFDLCSSMGLFSAPSSWLPSSVHPKLFSESNLISIWTLPRCTKLYFNQPLEHCQKNQQKPMSEILPPEFLH